MRSLLIRFKDCEGGGILEPILREKGYRITYHNAYDTRIHLVPEAHLMFDLVVLLGGPQTVVGTENDSFFAPYFELTENMIATPGRKVIGICLGSQIIAKVLGAKVFKGDKGVEVGFSPVKILKPTSPVFQGITDKSLHAFHLHEDSFTLPEGAAHLLESDLYPLQMFSYKDKAFAIQAHFEPNLEMLEVWRIVHKDFIAQGGSLPKDLREDFSKMSANGKLLFQNILGIK